METEERNIDHELTLDGNAVAGLLREVFTMEVTEQPAECANCGNLSAVGGLVAYTQTPGVVLRCPACGEVMMRLVRIRDEIIFEARGTAIIRLSSKT